MARLDPVFAAMFTHQATELTFEMDAIPVMRTPAGELRPVKQALRASQLASLFAEIVPEKHRETFPQLGAMKWTYPSPAGKVHVTFERTHAFTRALVKRNDATTAVARSAEQAVQAALAELAPPATSSSASPVKGASPSQSEDGRIASASGTARSTMGHRSEDDANRASSAPSDLSASARSAFGAPSKELAAPEDETDSSASTSAGTPAPSTASFTPAPRNNLKLVTLPHATKDPLPLVLPPNPAQAMLALLRWMLSRKASDMHLTSGNAPVFRIDGEIAAEPGTSPIAPELLKQMLWSITPERNRAEFDERSDSDFAYELDEARFRVNLFRDRSGVGAVLRQIPSRVRTAEELGLPPSILQFCSLQKGLVLVTGPTGSGKSTTLAAMIDHINRNRTDHIITIEDPIEFVHTNQKCLVNQREVGVHTRSFKDALRAALREDPDVVLVGELRDLETISIALETAETGHLVFGTLHTNTAPSTIERIADQFPADRQAQVRVMLSESLKGVVAQTLCKREGGGRVAALEILVGTSAISNLIREGKTFQIASAMQTGRSLGMATLNDALLELVKAGTISHDEALKRSVSRSELKVALERIPRAGSEVAA